MLPLLYSRRLGSLLVPLLLSLVLCGCDSTPPSASPVTAARPAEAAQRGSQVLLPMRAPEAPPLIRPASPQATPTSDVPKLQAFRDASKLASKQEGRTALVGGGLSMNPVYGDNTMLVVHPIAYEELRAGMTVVYLSRTGRRVAHQLLVKEKRGWRAQGINNETEDLDLVTPENLIGIVYASIVSE